MENIILGVCPFCGEDVVANDINLLHLECTGKWHFSHYCCIDEEGNFNATFAMLGDTREEIIDRCKASLKRKEDNNA